MKKKAILLLLTAFFLLGGKFQELSAQKWSDAKAVWPLPHMKDLPSDYLARLEEALHLNANRIDQLTEEDKQVHWVRSGICGYTLGENVDKLNKYFEKMSTDVPDDLKWGFSLFSVPEVRLYALFNDRTGVIKGRLSSLAQKKFEKYFYEKAKKYSRLAEAQRGIWDMEGSENHHLTSKISDFLVAQFLKDHPVYADLKYNDGSTAKQQYQARLNYWNKWIDEHAKRGLFIEDGGSSYQNYTIEALFNLRDFAKDITLKKKADMFLDLVFANIAEETLRTQRGGPKTRTKDDNFRSRSYDLLFDSPGESSSLSLKELSAYDPGAYTHSFEINYVLSTSDYYPPPAIRNLAKDISTRGVYGFIKRSPGAVVSRTTEARTTPVIIKRSKWRTIDRENTMLRVGFATSHYNISSHGLNTTVEADPYRAQRWQGIVFANDPLARIEMDGKKGVTKGPYISNPFKTIQDRNIMVTMKWGPQGIPKGADPYLWIHFSPMLDAVEEGKGWIFVKSGSAFAAVKVVEGGYKWSKPWKQGVKLDPKSKSCIYLNSDSPIITVANDAADYDNNFESFKKALKAQPVHWSDGVLKFATITHEGPLAPGKVNGKTVELKPALVNDSPFIRSKWDSGIIYIRKGDDTVILDFSDPSNPVRTVGAKITSDFPSGMGDSKPVIFSSKESHVEQ